MSSAPTGSSGNSPDRKKKALVQIREMFKLACRKAGLSEFPKLSTASFGRPGGAQLDLFEGP